MIKTPLHATAVLALLLTVGGTHARAFEPSLAVESSTPASSALARMPLPEASSTSSITFLRCIDSPLSASLALLTLVAAALAVRDGRLRRRRGLSVVDPTLFSHVPGGRRKDLSAKRRISPARAWNIFRAAAHRALVLLIVAALVAGGAPAWAVDGDSVWNQSAGDGIATPLFWFDGTKWLPVNTIPNGTIDDGFIADFSRNPLSVAQQPSRSIKTSRSAI